MKKVISIFAAVAIFGTISAASGAQNGVAIQRIITNTRSELGQLAASEKAQKISDLMQQFDTQYQTWNSSCGQTTLTNPDVSDACKLMADQMRLTGIKLYGTLSDYLPDVAARYEQGSKAAQDVLDTKIAGQTPASLYQLTMEGISEAPRLGNLSQGNEAGPFDLEIDVMPDPTEKMFSVLEKLVPDFGKEMPEAVRAGNARVTMMKKAKQARYLAGQFSKAKFVLESQQEYGEIIINATNAVSVMPEVFGLQYSGARWTAQPNRKVLEYFEAKGGSESSEPTKKAKVGGFGLKS